MLPVFLILLCLVQENQETKPIVLAPLFSIVGQKAQHRFGEGSRSIGDLNNDGYQDICLSAHTYSGPKGLMAGAVFFYSGFSGEKLLELHGNKPFFRFGASITSSDLNNDNRVDLIIGSPYAKIKGLQNCGLVSIYSGAAEKVTRLLPGPTEQGRFGTSLCSMDINGDGNEDFVVGAPGAGYPNNPEQGAVFCYSGFDCALMDDFSGKNPGDRFGTAICCMDSNGDGCADILISSPGYDGPNVNDLGKICAISGANGDLLYETAPKEEDCCFFGEEISPIKDLNGDGIQEIAALSRGAHPKVFVLDGASGQILFKILPQGAHPFETALPVCLNDLNGDKTPDLVFGGKGQHLLAFSGADGAFLEKRPCLGLGHRFGVALAGPFEETMTGFPRIAVAANPYENRGKDKPGEVHMFSYGDPHIIRRIFGPAQGSGFGASANLIGHPSTKDQLNLVISAPGAGAVFIYPQFGGKPILKLLCQGLGRSLVCMDDLDNDGQDDFFVGAPFCSADKMENAGAVYFYSSQDQKLVMTGLKGARESENMGFKMAMVGDDFLVSSPGYCQDDRIETGRVLLFSGKDHKILREYVGDMHRGRFGENLENIGDINNDGLSEFVCLCLRSPEYSNHPLIERAIVFSPKSHKPLYEIPALRRDEGFGIAFCSTPDLNADAIPDILVGAPLYQGGLGQTHGKAYLFSGVDGALLGSFVGGESDAHFGASITLAPDLDLDHKHEIAIASKNRIYLFSSKDLKLIHSIQCEQENPRFGENRFMGEDNTHSMLVCAESGLNSQSMETGAVYLLNRKLPGLINSNKDQAPKFLIGDKNP